MAVLKVVKNTYNDLEVFERTISYIEREDGAISGLVGVNALYAGNGIMGMAEQMRAVCHYYGKEYGQLIRHLVLSFDCDYEWWVTPAIAYKIAAYVVALLEEYQIVYAVHEDKQNIHIHFVICSVSYFNGIKFPDKRETYNKLAEMIPILYGKVEQTGQYMRVFVSYGK